MLFYGILSSERDSRPAKKGGDKVLRLKVNKGNHELAEVVITQAEGDTKPSLNVYYSGQTLKVYTLDTDDIPF